MNELRHATCRGKRPRRYWSPTLGPGSEHMNFTVAHFLLRPGSAWGAQPQPGPLGSGTWICHSEYLSWVSGGILRNGNARKKKTT